MKHEGNFINTINILGGDHSIYTDITKKTDFRLDILGKIAVGAAQQYVRLDSNAAQLFYAVLGRFGFNLTGGSDVRHKS